MTQETLRIIEAIKSVPEGKVSSYRDIALSAGIPNGARQVARILHSMTDSQHLPWHRIIKSDGYIAFPEGESRDIQCALLRAEGVAVSKTGRVCYEKYSAWV